MSAARWWLVASVWCVSTLAIAATRAPTASTEGLAGRVHRVQAGVASQRKATAQLRHQVHALEQATAHDARVIEARDKAIRALQAQLEAAQRAASGKSTTHGS